MELLVVPKSTPMAAVGMCRGGVVAVSKTLQIILAFIGAKRQSHGWIRIVGSIQHRSPISQRLPLHPLRRYISCFFCREIICLQLFTAINQLQKKPKTEPLQPATSRYIQANSKWQLAIGQKPPRLCAFANTAFRPAHSVRVLKTLEISVRPSVLCRLESHLCRLERCLCRLERGRCRLEHCLCRLEIRSCRLGLLARENRLSREFTRTDTNKDTISHPPALN